MATWGEILKELQNEQAIHGPGVFDVVRRKYIVQLAQLTGRSTILYATRWTDPLPDSAQAISITEEDVQAFMEVVHGLKNRQLDLVLHSPGGSPEATEAVVQYLRQKFDHIRVIVPHAAMSAATMLSCSADVVVMGRHSYLGPIDPQMVLPNIGVVPAQAVLDQFEQAKTECQDPRLLAAWAPMLRGYGPSLLVQCRNALDLSQTLVGKWLAEYMFKGQADGEAKAKAIGKWLSDHQYFKTHARHLPREELRARGMRVEDLEKDQKLQDAVLSVYHATTHTFNGTSAVKVVENQAGRAFVKHVRTVQLPVPALRPPQGPPGPPKARPPAWKRLLRGSR